MTTSTDKLENVNELIDSYRALATSTLGHFTDTGYLPDIKALFPCADTVVGRVLTVTLTSDNTDVIKKALIEATPGDVLCIDAQVLGVKACWGALRTCAAIYEQLAGVIVIGQVTDSLQIKQLGFPIFAQGVSAVTTFKSQQAAGKLAADIQYRFGMQTTSICNGDIAVMDNDGVFVLTPELAQQLLPDCQVKHRDDEMKLQLFMEAYQNNKLDQLLKQ